MTFAIHLPPYSQKVHLLSIARDSGVYANESRCDLPRCVYCCPLGPNDAAFTDLAGF